ncbi:MAG: regulatory protein RecX [Pseudomonadota bacterium]|nr:regulatory protein RecX [Pseudomonadota bacterium]
MSSDCAPDESELKEAAIRSLARREHSVHEIRGKLLRRGGDGATVEAVVAGLQEAGLLSNQRYAEQYCRSRANRGHGPVRVLHDLQQQRLDEALIEEAMAPYEEKWLKILEDVRQRRFGEAYPESYPQWAKQARFLQQRGFTSEQINRVLRKAY